MVLKLILIQLTGVCHGIEINSWDLPVFLTVLKLILKKPTYYSHGSQCVTHVKSSSVKITYLEKSKHQRKIYFSVMLFIPSAFTKPHCNALTPYCYYVLWLQDSVPKEAALKLHCHCYCSYWSGHAHLFVHDSYVLSAEAYSHAYLMSLQMGNQHQDSLLAIAKTNVWNSVSWLISL
jgi:hypothetical protein